MTVKRKDTNIPKKFKRFGSIQVSKIGSLNVSPDMLVHHLGCKPGDTISYFVGEDKESLVFKLMHPTKPLISDTTSKTHLKYLEGEDEYAPAEWKKKLKDHKII